MRILPGILSRLDDIRMTESVSATPQQRADWLRVLARSGADELERLAAPVLADYRFETLRAPETGLTMVRARIGNRGDRFNLGEATLTRCAVRLRTGDGCVTVGVGHVLGRDEAQAQRIAQLDALLQRDGLRPLLMRDLIEPLRRARQVRDHDQRARTEASRVRFFALQPETNA